MHASPRAPAFLHQSYEHDTVVDPCGFNSIAVVRPPEVYPTPETTPRRNLRWLVWVDKRRGLLGRTAVAYPTLLDPPAGRRQSSPSLSARAKKQPGPSNEERSVGRRRLSSLSVARLASCTGSGSISRTGEIYPNYKHDASVVGGVPELLAQQNTVIRSDGTPLGLRSAVVSGEFESVPTSSGHAHGVQKSAGVDDEDGVQVLLRGLNKPSRVAVAGEHSKGVFFIDHADIAGLEKVPCAALLEGSAHRQTNLTGGQNKASCPGRAVRTGRLRYLRWGDRLAVTLVRRLCNPIALCVSADGSVFVLEEVWERSGRRDRSRRYRVCYMEGSRLSAWFIRKGRRNFPVEKEGTIANISKLGNRVGGFQLNSMGAGNKETFPDYESETDWETSSTSSGERGNVDGDLRCSTEARAAGGAAASRSRRRGVVDVLEALVLSDSREEEPVDMCMLADGIMIIAFCRSTALHGGEAVAQHRGVLRAFPIADYSSATSSGPAPIGTVKQPDQLQQLDRGNPLMYGPDTSCLVAEGLPVITGLAASGGSAVFLSLCGAACDGTATAIGSVSIAQTRLALMRASTEVAERKIRRWSELGATAMTKGLSGQSNRRVRFDGGEREDNVVPIASGFAAALTVDENMNLFYVTAKNKAACGALWCGVPGAGTRRVNSLREIAPVLSVKVATQEKPETARNSREMKARAAMKAVVVAEATALTAAKRAASLSAALTEVDEALLAGSGGKTALFRSRRASESQLDGASGSEETRDDMEEDEPVNIVVVSRCRPLVAREIKRGVRVAVHCDGNEVVVSGKELPIHRSRRFGFDRVFGPRTSQARLYAEAVAPVIRKMLDGYNCSVLAYGQTGSGKTFTMEGGLSFDPGPAHGDANNDGPPIAKIDTNEPIEDDPVESTEKMGVIPRAVHTIFREGDGGGSRRFWVYVSHMEIYNERLFDLLAPEATTSPSPSPCQSPRQRSPRSAVRSPRPVSPRPLSPGRRHDFGVDRAANSHLSGHHASPRSSPRSLNQGALGDIGSIASPRRSSSPRRSPASTGGRTGGGFASGGVGVTGRGLVIEENREVGVMVKGLTQVEVTSPDEIFAIVARSKCNRRTAETMCNVESSRSHGIFCVRVISAEPTPWGGEITRDGRLSLVDLSGSENIKRSGAVGARAKEAAAIGQSLLALGRVMKALVQRGPHVPYRESKLTRVLADSLGGNAFTTIILNITPNHGMLDETLNTLAYAKIAQSVKNTPKQRIARKSPAEDATAGAGLPSGVEPLSCNIAKELKRRRGESGARRPPASAPSSLYVRPWESHVPIKESSCAKLAKQHPQGATGPPYGINRSREKQVASGRLSVSVSTPQLHLSENHELAMGGTASDNTGSTRGLLSSTRKRSTTAHCGRVFDSGSPTSGDAAAVPRVFDSTAAEWVHQVVLEPATPFGRNKQCWQERRDCSGPGSQSSADARLTMAARTALLEVFDRFDRGGRGFLLSSEVSSLEEIWTRPDAEPPPPWPRLPSPSVPLSKPARRASSHDPLETQYGKVAGDTRVLTPEAYLDFCRRAAARDAIFIRYMFRRSGYSARLEILQAEGAASSPGVSGAAGSGRGAFDVGGRRLNKKQPTRKNVANFGTRDRVNTGRRNSDDNVGGSANHAATGISIGARMSDRQEVDLGCMVTGGKVDPAELWDWTEDRRDHDRELHTLGGLLSRGGGARLSRASAATFAGDFTLPSSTGLKDINSGAVVGGTLSSSTKGQQGFHRAATSPPADQKLTNSSVNQVPAGVVLDHDKGDAGAGQPLAVSVICELPPTALGDRGFAGTVLAGVFADTPVGDGLLAGTLICEWCGGVVRAGSAAAEVVHTAAFCDEDVLYVREIRTNGARVGFGRQT